MNNSSYVGGISVPAHIDKLCDVVPNLKRSENDFKSLFQCLEESPKDCTPFKGKILQHIQAHALGNPSANTKLLSACFAKATILFRKTPNKSEGPLGAWKEGMLNELRNLDKNLNELYKIVGLNTSNLIEDDNLNQDDELKSQEKLSEHKSDFKTVINDYFLKVNWSAQNICALISLKTDYDLTVPVHILIKISSKICSLRWRDYKKKPNGLLRTHVYSLTPHLIDTSLMLYRSLVKVLGSNIIPFTPFINQSIIKTLEWTRISNLSNYDERSYLSIRLQIFKTISFVIEQLSLNLNLDPQQLKSLLEVEIVDNLNELQSNLVSSSEHTSLRNKHMVGALSCLENLLIIYVQYLEASLEGRIKSYVIQTCIKIYRDFGSNVISLDCRKQLLNLLKIIANQPYATSTTEISHHIFELAWKNESDPEIRSIAQYCLKVGLAHRPNIVAHYDVYNHYNQPMLAINDTQIKETNGATATAESTNHIEKVQNGLHEEHEDDLMRSLPDNKEQSAEKTISGDENMVLEKVLPTAVDEGLEVASPKDDDCMIISEVSAEKNDEEEKSVPEDENEVLSYMSHFVEKLA